MHRASDYDWVMLWNVGEILEAVSKGLASAAAAADEEQAVYGIDALDELGLHPLIQRSLRDGGFGVWPEQRYPAERSKRRTKAEGKRCDVVLTHERRDLNEPDAEQTLFSREDAVPLESAYWMEVKTVSQFTIEGAFSRYSSELLSPVSKDIRKLACDREIFHAGLLLVLFTADRAVAEADLKTWETKCLARGYPVAPPLVRHHGLTDRLGNAHMAVALFPVRRI